MKKVKKDKFITAKDELINAVMAGNRRTIILGGVEVVLPQFKPHEMRSRAKAEKMVEKDYRAWIEIQKQIQGL